MAKETETQAPPTPAPTEDNIKKMADLYHVPMSDETIKEVAKGADENKMKALEEYLKTSAEGLYPTLAPQLKSGIATNYLLDPYRQVAKSMLGDAFEPDFVGNPRDSQALSGGFDPKTQRPAPMSLDQWRQTIASDPRFGYDHTPHAIAAAQYAMQKVHEGMTQDAPMQQPGGPPVPPPAPPTGGPSAV